MSVPLGDVLARLRAERLPAQTPSAAAADQDAADSRWHDLFMRFFIVADAQVHDDLLFFVRSQPSPQPSHDQDAIIVRRRVPNVLPALSDAIDWKQSFFLNLICQLPCTLTVAVCSRTTPDPAATSADQPAADNPAAQSADPKPQEATASNNSRSQPLDDPLGATQTETPKPVPSATDRRSSVRSRMIAKRRITKKVFAAPFKSRMDVKDALMNECSYPLVYYTVNDFESHVLHLPIREREYLCVELSLTIPDSQSPEAYTTATDAVAAISVDQDASPFPLPPQHSKVILFQGAVPYTSLLDIYQQKGLAAQNQLKNPWSKSHPIQQNASLFARAGASGTSTMPMRTEYIMMRGPHGRGQCQVALAEAIADDESDHKPNGSSEELASAATQTLTDRLKMLGSAVKNQLLGNNSGSNSGSSSGDYHSFSKQNKKLQSLRCSMTYVNVPWQSIVADILDHSDRLFNQAIKP